MSNPLHTAGILSTLLVVTCIELDASLDKACASNSSHHEDGIHYDTPHSGRLVCGHS